MPISLVRVSRVVLRFFFALLFLTALPNHLKAQVSQDSALFKQDARDALNQGVQAFKNGQFDEAVRLFTLAKQLDPSVLNASLYLATAYASQYIPGAPSDENVQNARSAEREYKEVLNRDPDNLSAIDGLASILYQTAGQPFSTALFEESKSYHKKHTELRPNDPQPYYSIGVIDWALSYRANTQLRADFNRSVGAAQEAGSSDGERGSQQFAVGLRDTDPLPEVIRLKYADDFGPTIDEGIAYLKHAIQLKPDYDDAMVYLNLLYRRKADVVATPAERDGLTSMADDLIDRVKDIKEKRAEAPTQQSEQ